MDLCDSSGRTAPMIKTRANFCLVVSNEHFKTNIFHSLRGLCAPAALVIVTALAMYCVILRWL